MSNCLLGNLMQHPGFDPGGWGGGVNVKEMLGLFLREPPERDYP